MDQLNEGNPTILVAGDDSESTGVYYAIPVVMGSSDSESGTTNTVTYSIPSDITNGTNQSSFATTVASTKSSSASTSTTFSNANHEEIDAEYAQFAAEHAHISPENFVSANNISISNNKGSIVKAEPLQICSDTSGQTTQTIEMFTM